MPGDVYYGNRLMGGDKSDAFVGRRFASAGFATAVVNYRLLARRVASGPRSDAAASFAWVKRHIREYGGNPERPSSATGGDFRLAVDRRALSAAHKLSPRDIPVRPRQRVPTVERRGAAPIATRAWARTERSRTSPAHH
jgi:hypothetical protein